MKQPTCLTTTSTTTNNPRCRSCAGPERRDCELLGNATRMTDRARDTLLGEARIATCALHHSVGGGDTTTTRDRVFSVRERNGPLFRCAGSAPTVGGYRYTLWLSTKHFFYGQIKARWVLIDLFCYKRDGWRSVFVFGIREPGYLPARLDECKKILRIVPLRFQFIVSAGSCSLLPCPLLRTGPIYYLKVITVHYHFICGMMRFRRFSINTRNFAGSFYRHFFAPLKLQHFFNCCFKGY